MKRMLREIKTAQKPYRRSDPDSRDAYFETEEPNIHLDVGASFDNLQFVWDRHKSNENLTDHFFTHYLTRRLYCNDKYRVLDGQKVGKDTVKIKTEEGNTGLLCASVL